MSIENPYQSPQSDNPRPRTSGAPSIGLRCLRAFGLGLAGFVAYAAVQTIEIGTARYILSDSRYWIGFLVASALSGSELLLIPHWPWGKSILRRIILSALLMFPACFFAAYLAEAIDPPMPSFPGGPSFGLFAALGVASHVIVLLLARTITSRFAGGREHYSSDPS